jgi:hypothetical protein
MGGDSHVNQLWSFFFSLWYWVVVSIQGGHGNTHYGSHVKTIKAGSHVMGQ